MSTSKATRGQTRARDNCVLFCHLHRVDRHLEHFRGGFRHRVLQDAALEGGVVEVLIDGV